MEGGGGNRAEAERWLYTANKLLSARDLHGARSFALRARESDPRFDATDLLLAVIDTLLAADARINDLLDCYSILQVLRYTPNIDYIAAQYRRLAILLDPHRNPFVFSAHAFTLVNDAWSLLSNPTKKAMYDNELRLLTEPPPPPPPPPVPVPHVPVAAPPAPPPAPAPAPAPPAPFPVQPPRQNQNQNRNENNRRKSPNKSKEANVGAQEDNASSDNEGPNFWTACPYCLAMHEYPNVYRDCTLRCPGCRLGFHAVVVRSPPLTGEDGSFCSWGFFPVGFSGNFKDISGSSSNWNPFSPLFPCPSKGESNKGQKGNWVLYDDEESAEFMEQLSDTSDDDSSDGDWRGGSSTGRTKRRRRRRRRKGSGGAGGYETPRIERPRRGVHNSDGHVNAGGDNGEAVDAASAVPNAASVVPNAASVVPNAASARAESSKKATMVSTRRRAAGNLGKLDLNVEFSNEVEEPVRRASHQGNVTGNAEENIEGIGFFEGLDEFLSSLPILNVVGDDKVKT